jgi:2-hydroxy-3-keto-5-methylthiopentenyl-1-phosphate phosphatase
MQATMSLIVVVDFDGTLTLRDVGDELCERFAPPEWKAIDDAWVRNEITLPEAQRRMWGLVRARRDQAVAWARQVGERRPGLAALADRVSAAGGELWLASGGFDFYIDALLGDDAARFAKRFCNAADFDGDRVSLRVLDGFSCDRCAVCKGRICRLAKLSATQVIFVGDGSSDRCVVGHADKIFAVRDGILHHHAGPAATPFTTLDDIGDRIL